ncbi:MAG: hypothetical protein ABH951_00190 [Patescibacteria group bacterium]
MEDSIPNLNKENKEEKPELEAVPIFRNNDLYAELFPEIKPAFEKGEEPTVKKILDAIIQYKDKKVILDSTCAYKIMDMDKEEVSISDFPKEFELNELPDHPTNEYIIDTKKIFQLLKEKFNITIVSQPVEDERFAPPLISIDEKIAKILASTFSQELIGELFSIAKQKNQNIKKVYILTENINDHIHGKNRDEVIPTVISVLTDEVKKNFGIEPIILPTMSESEIKDGDLIVVDRHNLLVRGKIVEQKPTQFSMLPMETELSNNERYLENKPEKSKLIILLHKEFEKEEEKKEFKN